MALKGTRIREFDLIDLLRGIDEGRIGLPNFQRDFEWTDGDVRSLMATVLSGWPMGSLLVIEPDENSIDFYQPREFEYAPTLLTDSLELIVLDGQQRLTALYQAFYGTGPSGYAIKLPAGPWVDEIDAVDNAIRSFKRREWLKKFSTVESLGAQGFVPASALREATDFYEWRDSSYPPDRHPSVTAMYRDHFSGLHRYRVPAVQVGNDLPVAAVARIFERVNRTGRRLSTFDLMVAKSFTQNFNLRTEWDLVSATHPEVFRHCGDDGLPILSVIALKEFGSVRQSAVLDLQGATIRRMWDKAVSSFAVALDFARNHCGVLDSDWLPYGNLLTVLAALAYDDDLKGRSSALRAWFFATVFGGRYSVASNTTAASDYEALSDGGVPKMRTPVLVQEELYEATKQHAGAMHRGILCLLGTRAVETVGTSDVYVRAESVFAFGEAERTEPPAHLRSLTFVLRDMESPDGELLAAESQFLPPGRDLATFLEQRAIGVRSALEVVLSDDIALVSSAARAELEAAVTMQEGEAGPEN